MNIYLITAVAKKVGVHPDTVRSYCRQGLLKPIRDSAGRRLFTDADIRRVREIHMKMITRRPSRTGERL